MASVCQLGPVLVQMNDVEFILGEFHDHQTGGPTLQAISKMSCLSGSDVMRQ
jgi:hypothetical protein